MEGTIGTSTGQWLLGTAVLLLLCGQVMCRPGSGLCPPEVPEVQCVRDPCQNAACPTYPAAVCRANYCGGCNADFYLGGKKVDCALPIPPPICPLDKPLHYCKRNPCDGETCPRYPSATCTPDYCGGCNARFYVGKKLVSCSLPVPPPICPLDKPLHYCKRNPCDGETCPRYPSATCTPDYCGGCNARFYVGKKLVSCTLPASCTEANGDVHQHGDTWKSDACTHCRCVDGTTRCFSLACRPAPCPPGYRHVYKKDQCCPVCERRTNCTEANGDVHQHGETWKSDACTHCGCINGTPLCFSLACRPAPCSPGYRHVNKKDQCCPVCERILPIIIPDLNPELIADVPEIGSD